MHVAIRQLAINRTPVCFDLRLEGGITRLRDWDNIAAAVGQGAGQILPGL